MLFSKMRVLQIANYIEGVGGISVQVKLLRDNLRNDGVACDILSTKGTLFQRIRSILKLIRIGKNYDIFHIHACSGRGFLPAIIGVSTGQLLKKRTILTYHGGGAEAFFKRRTRLIRYFLNRTSANIALSGFTGKVFDSYGIKYTIIPNILELDAGHFKVREQIGPKFISTRTLSETYNIECTFKAFKIIQSKYPKASLTLLGDGPLRQSLELFVRTNNLNNVEFVGQVSNSDIYDYLDKADIMVSSSRFDNMPVSILEGMNAGLLVIASNVGGVPYMLRDGVTGLLFTVDKENELASQMLFALEHQEECKLIIRNAQNETRKYSWDVIRNSLINLIQC